MRSPPLGVRGAGANRTRVSGRKRLVRRYATTISLPCRAFLSAPCSPHRYVARAFSVVARVWGLRACSPHVTAAPSTGLPRNNQPSMSGRGYEKSPPVTDDDGEQKPSGFVHTPGRHLMVAHELHGCNSFHGACPTSAAGPVMTVTSRRRMTPVTPAWVSASSMLSMTL